MKRSCTTFAVVLGIFGLMATGFGEVAAQTGGFNNSGSNGFRSVGNGGMAAQREMIRFQADEIQIQQDIISTLQTSQNIGNINLINQYGDGRIDVRQNMSGNQSLLANQRGPHSSIPGSNGPDQ